MAVGDLYRVTLFQNLSGQDIQNVFYYRQTVLGTGVPAVALVNAFQSVVLAELANTQANELNYNRVLGQNLFTETDNAEDESPTPTQGALELPAAPTFIAGSMRSNRSDLSKRYSWKRFAGWPVSRILNDGWTAEQLAAADLLEIDMAATLANSANVFIPVSVGIDIVAGIPTPVERYVITQWTTINQVTSQSSRKIGRGD